MMPTGNIIPVSLAEDSTAICSRPSAFIGAAEGLDATIWRRDVFPAQVALAYLGT